MSKLIRSVKMAVFVAILLILGVYDVIKTPLMRKFQKRKRDEEKKQKK